MQHRQFINLGNNVIYPLQLENGKYLLIDAGPDFYLDTLDSWHLLTTALEKLTIKPSDIEKVLITHAHIDHAGLASKWAHFGATILVNKKDISAVELGNEHLMLQKKMQHNDIIYYGFPEYLIENIFSSEKHPQLSWNPCAPEKIKTPKKTYHLMSGNSLEILEAPGHTPGNLVCFIPQTGELFSGDTLLPTTIPTPGMHYISSKNSQEKYIRWPSLPDFIETVKSLQKLKIKCILPGHGTLVDDPEKLFKRFNTHHQIRAERIRKLLSEHSDTPFGLAKRQYPKIPERRLIQAMIEIIGHLDVLVTSREVEFSEKNNTLFYAFTK